MPRKSYIVPMVTTIDGTRKRVTMKPLKAPQTSADREADEHQRRVPAPPADAAPSPASRPR